MFMRIIIENAEWSPGAWPGDGSVERRRTGSVFVQSTHAPAAAWRRVLAAELPALRVERPAAAVGEACSRGSTDMSLIEAANEFFFSDDFMETFESVSFAGGQAACGGGHCRSQVNGYKTAEL